MQIKKTTQYLQIIKLLVLLSLIICSLSTMGNTTSIAPLCRATFIVKGTFDPFETDYFPNSFLELVVRRSLAWTILAVALLNFLLIEYSAQLICHAEKSSRHSISVDISPRKYGLISELGIWKWINYFVLGVALEASSILLNLLRYVLCFMGSSHRVMGLSHLEKLENVGHGVNSVVMENPPSKNLSHSRLPDGWENCRPSCDELFIRANRIWAGTGNSIPVINVRSLPFRLC
jgi:hypothetical protein